MNSGRAVVLGGGIAGLLAARVLADHFDRVTLVERDLFPNRSENRRGTPQGAHFHALLVRGERALSRLFPGLARSLVEGGATAADMGEDIRWHRGNYQVPFSSGLIWLSQSRPFLEWHLRQRVFRIQNVECLSQCEVEDLLAASDAGRVTGVKIRRRHGAGEERLDAGLVVDATGRGSLSPKWLQQLGYPKPRESVIKPDMGYASRTYRRRPGDLMGAKMLEVYPAAPRETRGGVLVPIEQDRWLVSLGGFVGDHPPSDERGFLDFAQRLPVPDIYDVIKRLEPMTDIVAYKFLSSVRRHYEDMVPFPAGYVIMGDALCCLNPQYGQGMTLIALQAEALQESLARAHEASVDSGDFSRRFFRRTSRLVAGPWRMATDADLRYPQVAGARGPWTKFFGWYLDKIDKAAAHDPRVHGEFLKVVNLLQSPTSMLRPGVLFRVLSGNLSRGPSNAPKA